MDMQRSALPFQGLSGTEPKETVRYVKDVGSHVSRTLSYVQPATIVFRHRSEAQTKGTYMLGAQRAAHEG